MADKGASRLSGMTGFSRVAGEAEWGVWAWEAKSVNGRGLDVRVNTPSGFDALERCVRSLASKRFKRGSLQIGLRIEMDELSGGLAVNEDALAALVAAHEARTGASVGAAELATLMTVKGVVEAGGGHLRDLASREGVAAVLSAGAETALDRLKSAREDEGAALKEILSRLIDQMEEVCQAAQTAALHQPALLKARLETQLAELTAEGAIDAERQAAEVAVNAAKADVREELDRLNAHFEGGRKLLAEGSPAGRKLDFLAQELNREANTLCSKSISLDLTNAGLSLKALIDQFKEQAANVE